MAIIIYRCGRVRAACGLLLMTEPLPYCSWIDRWYLSQSMAPCFPIPYTQLLFFLKDVWRDGTSRQPSKHESPKDENGQPLELAEDRQRHSLCFQKRCRPCISPSERHSFWSTTRNDVRFVWHFDNPIWRGCLSSGGTLYTLDCCIEWSSHYFALNR